MSLLPARGLYAIVDLGVLRTRPEIDPAALAATLALAGASFVQLRAKATPASEVLALARSMAPAVRAAGARFIVNDRVDVAALCGADGVHLGQDDLPVAQARRIFGDGAIIGLSTHDLSQVRAAQASGADYLGFGPVFGTQTKKTTDAVLGTLGLATAASVSALPIAAIGGVRLEAAREIRDAGAAWAAVIADLLEGDDPADRARAFVRALAG